MFKDNFKFSILIPFNGEETIHKTLQSVLTQSFLDYEILLIDDSEKQFFRVYMPKYEKYIEARKLKVFSNSKKQGLTRSLNIGLKQASGEFIVRCDADDEMRPDRLKILNSYFSEGYEFIGNASEFFYENGNSYKQKIKQELFNEEIKNRLAHFETVCSHSSFAFDKKIIMQLSGYNEIYKFAQDRDLLLRLLSIDARMIILPNILTNVFLHTKSISQSENRTKQALLGITSQVDFELRERGLKVNSEVLSQTIEKQLFWKIIRKSELCKTTLRHKKISISLFVLNLNCYILALFSQYLKRQLLADTLQALERQTANH